MPRTPQDRVKVNVYLQGNVLAALKKIALLKGSSYSELLRIAAAEYVVREGTRALESKRAIEMASGEDISHDDTRAVTDS